jgi:hypothetical protein
MPDDGEQQVLEFARVEMPVRKRRGAMRGAKLTVKRKLGEGIAEGEAAKEARRRGNQPFVPTDDQRYVVSMIAAHGTQQAIIAKIMRISEQTLRRFFRAELDEAFEQLKGRIQGTVASRALQGDMGAAKFWLARYCPEWRLAKEVTDPSDVGAHPESTEVVHFYMPPNGRDQPDPEDEDEAPIIEGTAEEAA